MPRTPPALGHDIGGGGIAGRDAFVAVAADQAGGLQARSGQPIRRAFRRRRGQEISSCGGTTVEMGADRTGAVGIGTAQRELHPRAHVLGRPVRLAVAADGGQARPVNVPSGFAARGQIWPLSRWVCMSTKQGNTIAPSMSTSVAAPSAILPSARERSVTTRSSSRPIRQPGTVTFFSVTGPSGF